MSLRPPLSRREAANEPLSQAWQLDYLAFFSDRHGLTDYAVAG
ncbi:hypothetical protein KCQ_09800 [Pectobacterium atrosepticum ICMP 1526]|nr:hypothetical protein KCQ_09800 [Pectobacterium atrosepticum ICMP 1526]